MIVAAIIITTLALYGAFILMYKDSWTRRILIAVTGVLFLGSLFLVYANDHNHYGMKKVTTTETSTIYSASPSKQLPLLLRQDVGTNGDYQVYIYKTDPQKKATHTKADYDIHNTVQKVSGSDATLTEKKTVWRYKSNFWKTLYMNQNQNQLIYQRNTIKVPANWTLLTPNQAKALGKRAKAMQHPSAAQKAKMGAVIQQAVMAAKMQNPAMTPAQQKQVVAQTTAKLQAQAMQKLIADVKATVK